MGLNTLIEWKQLADLYDSLAFAAITELRKYSKPKAEELMQFLMRIRTGGENGNSDPK